MDTYDEGQYKTFLQRPCQSEKGPRLYPEDRGIEYRGLDQAAGIRDELKLWPRFSSLANKRLIHQRLGWPPPDPNAQGDETEMLMREFFPIWYGDRRELSYMISDCPTFNAHLISDLLLNMNNDFMQWAMRERQISRLMDFRHFIRQKYGHVKWFEPDTLLRDYGSMNPTPYIAHEVQIHCMPPNIERGWNSEVDLKW